MKKKTKKGVEKLKESDLNSLVRKIIRLTLLRCTQYGDDRKRFIVVALGISTKLRRDPTDESAFQTLTAIAKKGRMI